ncbi:MAG: thioredoxin domain-containing protein [Myxococcota bacterium]|jgi:protein-disulfide isomerase|nr:thioredoxin domain-containing protein [Myxococcota bacterium]
MLDAVACESALRLGENLAYFVSQEAPPPVVARAMRDFVSAGTSEAQFALDDRPSRGSVDAPVQVVTFSDFYCPHCARFAKRLDGVLEQYGAELRTVFKHYPLSQHDHALQAARFAAAAQEQGKFWEMADAIFSEAGPSPVRLLELAESVGLDMQRLETDANGAKVAAIIAEDMREAELVDIPGTPAVYVNGVELGPDLSVERLRWVIETELWLHSKRVAVDEVLLAQSQGVVGGEAQPSGPEQYPVLSHFLVRLESEELKRFKNLTRGELCPCESISDSLDACLMRQDGGCKLSIQLAKQLMRGIVEGASDEELVLKLDAMVSEALQVHAFELSDAPYKGASPEQARVVVVEFADYRCPHCAAANRMVDELVEELDGVVVYFKHFPLDPFSVSANAAHAAVAAQAQGKFWEMHAMLFEHADALSDEDLLSYALDLGLELERFERELYSSETAYRVRAERAEGNAAGLRATPTFFVNGVYFDGSYSELVEYLRSVLASR